MDTWKIIFDMVKDVEFQKPLTPEILSNPKHSLVKMLVYIYTMESFIYKEINKASREKDTEKLKFYGPFASALSFIIHSGYRKQDQNHKDLYVYRGFKLNREELD